MADADFFRLDEDAISELASKAVPGGIRVYDVCKESDMEELRNRRQNCPYAVLAQGVVIYYWPLGEHRSRALRVDIDMKRLVLAISHDAGELRHKRHVTEFQLDDPTVFEQAQAYVNAHLAA